MRYYVIHVKRPGPHSWEYFYLPGSWRTKWGARRAERRHLRATANPTHGHFYAGEYTSLDQTTIVRGLMNPTPERAAAALAASKAAGYPNEDGCCHLSAVLGLPTPGCNGCIARATEHLLRCLPPDEGKAISKIAAMAETWSTPTLIGRLAMLERDRMVADERVREHNELAQLLHEFDCYQSFDEKYITSPFHDRVQKALAKPREQGIAS